LAVAAGGHSALLFPEHLQELRHFPELNGPFCACSGEDLPVRTKFPAARSVFSIVPELGTKNVPPSLSNRPPAVTAMRVLLLVQVIVL
jgi:hypothetical protein